MKKSFRFLLMLALVLVMVLSLTACLSDCEAGKHTFEEVAANDATCTEAGNIAYKHCSVCDLYLDATGKQISKADTIISAKGHIFDQEKVDADYLVSAATCEEPAVYYKSCKCGAKGTETFSSGSSNGHVFDQEVATADYLASAATCKHKATYYKSCVCGAKGTDTFEHGDLAAHTVGNWTTEVPATCIAEGTKGHYTCSVCEQNLEENKTTVTESLTIDKDSSNHEHTTHHDEVLATCKAEGKKAYDVCSDCGAFIVDGANVDESTLTIDKLEHGYGDLVTKQPATCTNTGMEEHYRCSSCEGYFKNDEAKTPTTAEDLTIAVDTINGHKPATDWTVGDDGKHYHVCQNGCGAHLDEVAHVFDQEVATPDYLVADATCQNKATYYKSCVCGAKGTETFEHGDLATHIYGEWHNEVPATCQTKGTKGYQYCSACEKNYDADGIEIADLEIPVDVDAHNYKYTDTSSTKHTATCQNEGCMHTVELAHVYDETTHLCVCGKTEPKEGWNLVTDASELKAGDKIIIVGVNGSNYYAMGAANSNNTRAKVDLTDWSNGIASVPSGVAIFVIGKDGNNYTFTDTQTQALLALTANDNKLHSLTNPSDDKKSNYSWNITISGDYATIQNIAFPQDKNDKDRTIQYNAGSGQERFACYSSTQKPVSIYKFYTACDHEGKETTTTTVNATCTEDGKITVTCNYCGGVVSETVLPAGHKYGEPVPTTNDTATHTYTCTVEGCGHSYTEEHIYENHICTKCNATEPTHTITVTNTAVDEKTATIVVKVGDEVITPTEGVYTIYQNSTVTVTIIAPEGYVASAKLGENDITLVENVATIEITNADVTLTVTITAQASEHDCTWGDWQFDSNKLTHTATCTVPGCGKTKTANCTIAYSYDDETDADNHCVTCTTCHGSYSDGHKYDATTHKCVCEKFDPSVVTTIADALTANVGTLAMFSGIVEEIKEVWNTQYGNMSVWVSDGTDKILVYRTTTQVGIGDKVTVNGEIGSYNNANQIAAGDTITIDEKHTCTDFTTADCINASVCTVCGAEHSPALGHSDVNPADGTCDRCGADMNAKSWKLVTDVSALQAGDTIIIVAKDSNYALSTTQNDNNRGQAAVTKSNNTINTVGDDVQIITLEVGTIDGTFAFNTGSGYLYAASSKKNYLKTETSLSANSSWSITIAEDGVATIQAQGTNTRNLLKYNNSSSIFSCYGSGQQDVVIYKLG